MIRISIIPAPPAFDKKVRDPGEAFLKNNPKPSGQDWKRNAFWVTVHDYLHQGYSGICSYCASWSPRNSWPNDPISTSIDHYVPKSVNPQLAYEWTNFRLCRLRLNLRKGEYQDVLDPCKVSNAWFVLNFRTFRIRPAAALPGEVHRAVTATIERLELNDNDYVQERIGVLQEYCLGKITFDQLRARYPFIAYQVEVQSFDTLYLPMLQAYFKRSASR